VRLEAYIQARLQVLRLNELLPWQGDAEVDLAIQHWQTLLMARGLARQRRKKASFINLSPRKPFISWSWGFSSRFGLVLLLVGLLSLLWLAYFTQPRQQPVHSRQQEAPRQPVKTVTTKPLVSRVPALPHALRQQLKPQSKKLPAYSWQQLKFVGYLQQNKRCWGLIKTPEDEIVNVHIGDYLGKQSQQIVAIHPHYLLLQQGQQLGMNEHGSA
jgi:hypothetical protein